jgi:hypothetical protein
VDVLQDLIVLTCDPKTVTPEQVLDVVRRQGFQGTIVPNKPPKQDD